MNTVKAKAASSKPAKTTTAKEPSTEVAAASSTALASANDMFGSGGGLENVTSSDILIPRLGILQGLSPQVNRSKPEFIDGANVGDIADLGIGEILGQQIHVLPIHYHKQYLEWAPRNTGKGLINIHSDRAILDECTRDDKGKFVLPNGNYIAETAQWIVSLLSHDNRLCFIPMTSTQLKKSKKWLTLATGEKLKRSDGSEFMPDLWYRTYKLSTIPESNNEGDWIGWKVDRDVTLPEHPGWESILDQVKRYRASIASGEMKADVSSMSEEVSGGASNDGAM